MRTRYLLIVCCCLSGLLAPLAQAQTNFRPGYVLPLTGDTLRGEVDLRDGRTNAERCRYRANEQASVTTYAPTQLRGYGVVAKQYRAFTVAAAVPKAYFLEILVAGPASLYFLRDAEQHDLYFVATPTMPLAPLEHSIERVVRDNRTYTEEKNTYRNTLEVALSGCTQAQAQLPNLPFQESALRKVVSLYNACMGYQVPQASPTPSGSRVAFGLMTGVGHRNLSLSGYPYNSSTLGDYTVMSQSSGYIVGPVVRIGMDRMSQKLAMVIALLYEPEKYEWEGKNRRNLNNSDLVTLCHFDLAYLRLPVMLRYTYPRGKVTPVVEAGLTVAYAVKMANTFEDVNSLGYHTQAQPLFAGNEFQSLQLGAGLGLGLSTRVASDRSLALLLRAEKCTGFSGTTGSNASILRFYGLLSFDLTH